MEAFSYMNLIDERLQTELSHGTQTSVIRLVNLLVEYAYEQRASDIHIDPRGHSLRVRMRIDGALIDTIPLPKILHSEIISRIKILSRLRTDEQYTAQDGRFRYTIPKKDIPIDIRVSIIPTYHGENCVMRLLRSADDCHTLDSLGFSELDQKKIMKAIQKSSGMILVTGPTGSGKTTTLYTLLSLITSKDISIVTIEDPIEYAIADAEQIQVNNKTGITFANGLRSVLRQDPNVIMVGEIRDEETARIAINTALTGHLLFSTLHTNDSVTTIPRLIDMNIESYLVASTVTVIIGQRLVRRICPSCKTSIPFEKELKDLLRELHVLKSHPLLRKPMRNVGSGCLECNYSGYHGRIALYEILVADTCIREKILKKTTVSDLRETAIQGGMTPLLIDGMYKVEQGHTTLEEVLRVIHE